jgi:hypothetical protein
MQDETGKGDQRDRVPLNPLGDEDAWNEAFGPGLKDKPEVAQEVAQLLSIIKDSAEPDPRGIEALTDMWTRRST